MDPVYTCCTLCPRECRADRTKETGYCGMSARLKAARAALHFWEEPCISGTRGSGTVFFSGCTLRCVYCQNYPISHEGFGREITPQRLSDIFRELVDLGAHNINLVTGTMFIPDILDALARFTPPVPVVWNSGGYEKPETLKLLEGAVQVYLPDLKHASPRLAALCAGAPDYAGTAVRAIAEMRRQTGTNVYDDNGLLLRGVLIRHLILPGCTADSMQVLNTVSEQFPGTPVSLMRQYSPEPWCTVKGLDRRVTDREYHRVLEHYRALGLSGYTQEKESAMTGYTPDFDLTGV